MHLGMNVIAGIGEPGHDLQLSLTRVTRNLGIVMARAEPASLPVAIQSEATNIRSYSFSLTNGDTLIALWTDGVAVDEDPGVKADLTFQGFGDQEVTGIDVLVGFQQQMITAAVDGNLVVRDLHVRDYPIILWLSPTA